MCMWCVLNGHWRRPKNETNKHTTLDVAAARQLEAICSRMEWWASDGSLQGAHTKTARGPFAVCASMTTNLCGQKNNQMLRRNCVACVCVWNALASRMSNRIIRRKNPTKWSAVSARTILISVETALSSLIWWIIQSERSSHTLHLRSIHCRRRHLVMHEHDRAHTMQQEFHLVCAFGLVRYFPWCTHARGSVLPALAALAT